MPTLHPTEPVFTVERKALLQTEIPPVNTRLIDDGTLFIDFGKSAFGTLLLPPARAPYPKDHIVHLGEKLAHDGRLDRNPPGSIRYIRIHPGTGHSRGSTRVRIPPDQRNTGPAAIPMPDAIGEVYPSGMPKSNIREESIPRPSVKSRSTIRLMTPHRLSTPPIPC